MFSRTIRRRIFGRELEIDLYAPRVELFRDGVFVKATTPLVARKNFRDWRWVFGIRLLGFGIAVAEPKGAT